MFTISFHAWRSGWIASQSSFVYHLRRSSESCFSWRKTSSASQCFQALIGRKLHGGVLFVFFLHGQTFNVGYIFVSYVDIARIPFPGLEADLALGCFFFFFTSSSFQITIFYICPEQAFFFILFSLLISFVQTTLQQHRAAIVTVSYVSKLFLFLLRFYTLRDYISKHSQP
jgi:hypothetical protein